MHSEIALMIPGQRSEELTRDAVVKQLNTFSELDAVDFTSVLDQIVPIYLQAMGAPHSQFAGRRSMMQRHATYPEFRALTVTADSPGEIIAFSYGWQAAPGQKWTDRVSCGLASLPAPTGGAVWLEDSLVVAELQVRPDYQGRGVGRGLLLRLLADRAERTAVLSAYDADSPARRLYRRVGFIDLLTGFMFPKNDKPWAIMGAELPLRQV